MIGQKVIKFPLATEKSIRLMESENKLVFVIDRSAKKADVKNAIEDMFKAKVLDVNVCNDIRGRKKAFVRFSDDVPAIDIATKLGLM
jgi:ribosomal protein uL23